MAPLAEWGTEAARPGGGRAGLPAGEDPKRGDPQQNPGFLHFKRPPWRYVGRGCLRPLKGERPGWLSLAGVRPASSPWTTPGWAL